MDQKLANLAQIMVGYAFREAIVPKSTGDCKVVQVRDINVEIPIDADSDLISVDSGDKKDSTFLKNNDILLSTRGIGSSKIKVGIYKGVDMKTIAASSLFILRVNSSKITPEYLLYYLNSFYGQNSLKNVMVGSTILAIPKKDLDNIKIPIISKEKQEIIINTMQNGIKQKKLLKRKIDLLGAITDNIITINY